MKLEIPFDLRGQDLCALLFLAKTAPAVGAVSPCFACAVAGAVVEELTRRMVFGNGPAARPARRTLALDLDAAEAMLAVVALDAMTSTLRPEPRAAGWPDSERGWCDAAAGLAAEASRDLAGAAARSSGGIA